jgi:hypothetical protein
MARGVQILFTGRVVVELEALLETPFDHSVSQLAYLPNLLGDSYVRRTSHGLKHRLVIRRASFSGMKPQMPRDGPCWVPTPFLAASASSWDHTDIPERRSLLGILSWPFHKSH